jgi:Ca2+/H+ antiporter
MGATIIAALAVGLLLGGGLVLFLGSLKRARAAAHRAAARRASRAIVAQRLKQMITATTTEG